MSTSQLDVRRRLRTLPRFQPAKPAEFRAMETILLSPLHPTRAESGARRVPAPRQTPPTEKTIGPATAELRSNSPSSCGREVVIQVNQRRPERNEDQRGEDKHNQRNHHFNSRLRCLLFSPLSALGSKGVGVYPQRLHDAGAETISLNQRCN